MLGSVREAGNAIQKAWIRLTSPLARSPPLRETIAASRRLERRSGLDNSFAGTHYAPPLEVALQLGYTFQR
jgi:hypothetical protein